MILTQEEYKNKMAGCFMGKTIGGTLGAPFECRRGVFDVTFYQQDLSKGAVPNDDLDLQLVWLNAAERYGRALDASILAEYWTSCIIPNWSEYGTGKSNLRMGLVPPISGAVDNPNKDSCGAFIRSEIWACLAPGHPEIAVEYAYQDACVDHGHEGVYGEIFFAALQSAAFVESDPETLIEVGLSYIPEECEVAKAIRTAVDCFHRGMDWKEAREKILTDHPGSFGALGTPKEEMDPKLPVSFVGYDAPSNIGLTVMAWMYGGEDFEKGICIAASCGEDADCTAGTLGAVMGIIKGLDGIPDKWKAPIGDQIATMCIDAMEHGSKMKMSIPRTVTELADRVMRLMPLFLGSRWCDILNPGGYTIETRDKGELTYKPERLSYWQEEDFKEKIENPYKVNYSFVLFDVSVEYKDGPFIRGGEEKEFVITLKNSLSQQQWTQLRWHLPEGFQAVTGETVSASLSHRIIGNAVVPAVIKAPDTLSQGRYDLVLEIVSEGRPTKGLISIVLIHGEAARFDSL